MPVARILAAGACINDLSHDERQKIGTLHQDADRKRAIAAHWLKRLVLAEFTGRRVDELVFTTTRYGKPELSGGPCFNISHAGEWVIIAVHPHETVGVDVERERGMEIWRDVIPVIRHEKDADVEPVALWTAKEAAAKAKGTGFLIDPRQIVIRRYHDGGFGTVDGFIGHWRRLDHEHMAAVCGYGPFEWAIR